MTNHKNTTDLRQTEKYAHYMHRSGWIVERSGKTFMFVKKLPLVSVMKMQRPSESLPIEEIRKVAKRNRTVIFYVEPKNTSSAKYYKKIGFSPSKYPFLPTKTIEIDLTKSERTLLSEMHHKTRYNIGLARRRGVVVKVSTDIEKFAEFWQNNMRNNSRLLSQKQEIVKLYESFEKDARILLAWREKQLLGGVLLLLCGDMAYYMYAAANNHGFKNFAPTLLVWSAISEAKAKGATTFDFEGVYDSRFPLKSWRGFSRFKKGFGGNIKKYPGAYRKLFMPF